MVTGVHVDLTVATFNIRNGLAWDGRNSWPLRRRATAKALATLDADIVGLQEVYGFQRRYLLSRVPGYRAVGKGRRDGRRGEQCPILVRDPVAIDADWTRWFGDEPEHPGSRLPGASFPRIATMATCHRADGDDAPAFDVVNVHLDEHLGGNRVRSIELLAEWLDGARPSLLIGDFNTTEDDEAVMGALTHGGFEFVPIDGGTAHDFGGRTDGLQLDHVLFRSVATATWQVRSARVVTERVDGRLPSDHWPVVVDLRLVTS